VKRWEARGLGDGADDEQSVEAYEGTEAGALEIEDAVNAVLSHGVDEAPYRLGVQEL
jgi:hypothetical protein